MRGSRLFTEEERRRIITLLFTQMVSVTSVAERFQVSITTILHIRNEYVKSEDARKKKDNGDVRKKRSPDIRTAN